MPVLLLARGDEDARDLLRKAIEARYGMRPPAFDSLRIDFSGRVHTRIGPVKTWVPLDLTAQFALPNAMRWDFVAKPIGIPVRRGVESYDGEHLRTMSGNDRPNIIEDTELVVSSQKRLWAIAALLLTPIGDHFVELSMAEDGSLVATNTQINTPVHLKLREDFRIEEVFVDCLNPDKQESQRFSLRPSEDLSTFDDLLLPTKIAAFWDDTPWFEMEPKSAEDDPELPAAIFSLETETV
jgi:hypothetical protein